VKGESRERGFVGGSWEEYGREGSRYGGITRGQGHGGSWEGGIMGGIAKGKDRGRNGGRGITSSSSSQSSFHLDILLDLETQPGKDVRSLSVLSQARCMVVDQQQVLTTE